MEATPLVFFISISTEPTEPGPDRYGTGIQWVLYGAPSEAEARSWAIAERDRRITWEKVSQKIREFVIVPMSDTLLSDQGAEPLVWTSMPRMRDMPGRQLGRCGDRSRPRGPFDNEVHGSAIIRAPNLAAQRGAQPVVKEPSVDEVRAMIERQCPDGPRFNWDPALLWYFIFYTSKQGMLVRAMNSIMAGGLYAKTARGTPQGDENAVITMWQELTKYGE